MIQLIREKLRQVFGELRRRHVFRVAAVYTLVGWAVVQVAETTFPALNIPPWALSLVVLLTMMGFPIAVVLAWAFEITPGGVRRTESTVSPLDAPPPGQRTHGVFPRRTAPEGSGAAPGWRPPAEAPAEQPGPPDAVQIRRACLAKLRHELRTPLNAILGYSEMLIEDAAMADLRELEGIHGAGQSLLGQVDALLKPPGGPVEVTEEEMETVLERVRSEVPPPARGLAEAARRAVARMREGGREEIVPDLERIVAAVDRLVELAENARKPLHEGGAGALPDAQTRRVAEQVIAPTGRRAGTGEDPPRHGHLLVVDDNPSNLDLLSRQLARVGFSVAVASGGAEALEVLRSNDFDLVLLDVLMPGVDGIQVLEEMQRDPTLAEIPVIMTSALDEIESVIRCIERGAVDYLTTPFDPVLLQARLGAALELHRLRAQQRHGAEDLRLELAWSDRLARSVVPVALVHHLRDGKASMADLHASVVVLALSFQGIGTFAARSGPGRLADRLDDTVTALERIVAPHAVELHWEGSGTVLISAGTVTPLSDAPRVVAGLSLEIREEAARRLEGAEPLRLGIGMHAGPAVSGLIDADRLLYGVWGEAADVARDLARQSLPREILVSAAAYATLYESHSLEARGIVETAGRSHMRVYSLLGAAGAVAARRVPMPVL